MRKINSKIFITLLLSICMINSVSILAVYSLNNAKADLNLDSKPEPAINANINAWIIVAGDRESDHALYYCIENGCDEVYDVLLGLGYLASDIYYMAANWDGSLPSRATNTSERTSIKYAIETWAADKVSSSLGLGIFLFDHGGTNSMSLPGPNLWDTSLNTYLNNLEAATGMTRSVIVYEACHSGSFINPVSKDNRIVVCATDSTHSSYPNAALTSAVFTEAFWSSISVGYTIGEAFENARVNVIAAGYGSVQKPWIDDNHDEMGHEVDTWGHLPNGDDGNDALNVHIRPPLLMRPFVRFKICPIRWFIKLDARATQLSVIVENNDTDIEYVKAVIVPPDWEPQIPVIDPQDPYDPEILFFQEQGFTDSYFDVFFTLYEAAAGSYNFTATLNLDDLKKKLGEPDGDFGIRFMAKTESNVVSEIMPSVMTINEDGEAPTDQTPPTVSITNPETNLEISDIINITAEGNDDQALDKIQILLDGTLLNETGMPSYYPYPEARYQLDTSKYENGIHNITAIAIDESGNQAQISVFVNFQNNLDDGSGFQMIIADFYPYLIGAGIGIGISIIGSLLFRRKRKR
ncbi:MAG: C13 family peptidase [Promethearchaeota archaeon]